MALHESPAQKGMDDLAGRDGRSGRAALQDHAHRAGRLRRREPAPRRGGAQGVRVHRRARAGPPPRRYRVREGRVSARRYDARERGEAEARLPEGRHGDRGELEWDQRWSGGTSRDIEGNQAPRAHRRDGGGWSRSDLHGAGPDPSHPEGSQTRGAHPRPNRFSRAERGLRGAGDRLHPRAAARPGQGEPLRRRDRALCDELREALALLTRSDAVRVIVITGAGRAFCAGADLDVLDEDGPALVAAGKDVALALRAAPQPVLAAVNGPAAGGRANLALACDYRIASDQASIGQGFHQLGLVPDWGGSFFLARPVGTAKALGRVWSARIA